MGRLSLIAALVLAAWSGSGRGEEATAVQEGAWIESWRRSADALRWSDEAIRHDWRLQRRPGTDECRILDSRDRVVRSGAADECRTAFAALESSGQIEPVRGPTVIVLHGLGEGRRSMQPLVAHLRASLDATVLAFGYASTSSAIADHGRALAAVVRALPGADRISFVGHSLGNLVVRSWMGQADAGDLDRLDRMVMLGPPNQGSELAQLAARFPMPATLSTGAARDLAIDWHRVAPTLPAPPCPFGIVAGGRGDDDGYSMVLAGDDDAVVRVEETRLAGEDDFLLVPVHHAAMMKNTAVQRAVTSFLSTGRFAPAATAATESP